MTLFEKIVAEILTEDVQIGRINDAINRTYEVKINYQSDTDKASGERIIQPVAYGLSKSGKPVIRAYQPYGDTQTKVPAWKFFLVSGIQSWKPLFKRTFNMPDSRFNPNGDKTMSVVYKIAKFFNTPGQEAGKQPTPVKASGPIKKSDVKKPGHISVQDNPTVQKLEKLKKQLDNPKYISDIVKNKAFGEESTTTEPDNSYMVANSGPVTKDTFQTQTEKDIQSRQEQLAKNQKVSQDVLDKWQKEQEKRQNNNGSNRNRIK
jgi:hypothetical protein